MVSTSYPIREGSVSGIFVKNLAEHLAEISKVTVIAPGDDQKQAASVSGAEKLVVCNYAPRQLQTLAHKPGGIPAGLRRNRFLVFIVPFLLSSMLLNVVVRVRKYDVLHCNWAITGFLVSLVRRFINIPVVTTLRGEDVKINSSRFSRFILSACIKSSDRVVLVSEEMHKVLSLEYPQYKSKFQTIYNGVDSIFLNNNDPSEAFDKKTSVLRIITVASLIPRKNISFILSALALCRKKGLKFEYVIVGSGEELTKLKTLAEKKLISEHVTFLGSLEPKDVAKELSKASVFLTSSKHEGRPNVVLEAMASGLCVLASDIAGHRELISDSDAGLIFDLDSCENLAELLYELASSQEKVVRFGRQARDYIVSEGLTWNACAENYFKLFKSLVSC